jgi:hypothetical protein
VKRAALKAAPTPADDVQIGAELVTPAQAREWLRHNIEDNRHVSPERVDQYARDMAAGAWRLNGETLKINENGELCDGQHRLLALDKASVPVWFHVAHGLPLDAVETVDIGRPRGVGDVIGKAGGVNGRTMGGIVRRVMMWDRGRRASGTGGKNAPSNPEIVAHYRAHISPFQFAAARGMDVRKHTGLISPVTYAAGFYLAARRGPTYMGVVSEFTDRFLKPTNLGERHPVYVLRERLLSKVRGRLTEVEKMALFVKALNYYSAGEEVENLLARGRAGLSDANFPDFSPDLAPEWHVRYPEATPLSTAKARPTSRPKAR